MGEGSDVTQLLNRWTDGDEAALEQVTPLVYDELKRIANGVFARERNGHTLQPTALVHEAYAKLIDVEVTWQDRAHFYALAARMMRRLLVNHAKARNAGKRGGLLRCTEQTAPQRDPPDLWLLFSPIKRLTKVNDPLQRGLAAAASIFGLVDEYCCSTYYFALPPVMCRPHRSDQPGAV